MSELRRNRGPDDGDKPADKVPTPDNPERPRSPKIRTADQLEGREVDRRKLTPIQRDFIRTEKEAADSGVLRKPITTYSMDWESGEHVDGWYDPPGRGKDHSDDPADSTDETEPDHSSDDLDRASPGNTPAERGSPYAEAPAELNRDNSGLEARSIQRTDDEFKELKPADATGGSRRRRVMNKVLEKSDTITSKVQDGAKTVDSILARPPAHPTIGRAPAPTELKAEQYGAHSPGDTVSALAAGALAVGMVISKMHDKYGAWKERHDGNG